MSILFSFLVFAFILAIPVLVFVLIIKAIRKKPLKKTAWGIAGCFIGVIVSAMLFGFTDPQSNCEHEYILTESTKATCAEAGKNVHQCIKCEKKIEEVLPILEHEWKEADCENPKTCQLCGTTDGEKGGHNWVAATCNTPKTCQICGETEGTVKNHTWVNATCTTPKVCSDCGLEEGEPLNADKSHTWAEATCSLPKTCNVCGETEGTTLAHNPGEWEVVYEGTSEEQGTKQKKCTVCGTVIETERFNSPSKMVADIIKRVVKDFSGQVGEIEIIPATDSDGLIATCAICCENSEQEVKDILAEIATELQKLDVKTEAIFSFGDVKEGLDGTCLAIGSIDAEGNYEVASMSSEFKTERNEWIKSQFSAWDGSHTVLKDLIKDNLNDEKSFKHIETTYIDIASEDKRDYVNGILADAGYSQRVEVGDLFVMTEFSAKNAFNATIKNTAFGIVDYSEELVRLIGIE